MEASNGNNINRKPPGVFFINILLVLVFLTVIMPNSFQVATAVAMVLSSFFSLFYISRLDISRRYFIFIYVSILVTLIYVIVGVVDSAPVAAVQQVLYIYIVSPVLWFLILTALLVRLGEKNIINFFIPIAWLCCFSVLIFFFLFEKYGASSVSLFKENANLNTKDGYSGATMHVYGSLIFIVGGFFAAPEVIKNKWIMILTLLLLAFCAIISGRTALTISIFIGFFVFLFFSSRSTTSLKARLGFLVSFLFVVLIVIYISSSFRGIDILYIMGLILDKIFSGGGVERSVQAGNLMESFFNNYGLGLGHGVGIDYIRSYKFPWRYETVWMATLHRVGLLGTLIYFAPFAFYIYVTFTKFIKKGLSLFERFFWGGFLCAFAASNTNPYLEGVTFQWMYMLPVLALLLRDRERKFL